MTTRHFNPSVTEQVQRDNIVSTLTALRLDLGLTQEQIAERMNTTRSAVSDFECRDNDDLKVSTAQRYADALGYQLVLGVALRTH